MKRNNPHIESLDDLLRELNNIESKEHKIAFINTIKKIQSDDDALKGAILFLEDHDWDVEELKNALINTNLRLDIKNKNHHRTKWMKSILKYAAVLIIPLGITTFYYLSSNNKSINQFYIKEPGLPNFMADTRPNKWDKSMLFFKKGDYKYSLELLNTNHIEKNNDTLLYFKAVCNYEMGNYKESLSLFKKHLKHTTSSFYYDSEFRIGFVWYKVGNIKKANEQFIKLAKDQNNPFYPEAKNIVKDVF